MWRKEQTLHKSKHWKIRQFTSESAYRSNQTSSLSTSQCHWRWWGEGLYKFSEQCPHFPFSSKHYSSWSPCTNTKVSYCATSKGGQGRAKFLLDIKRQENPHSTLCIDSIIPKKPRSQCSYPSNIWTGLGIQTSDQSTREENLVKILCKRIGTVSSRYKRGKGDKYSIFHSQRSSTQIKKSNIWQNIMRIVTINRGEWAH